MSELFPRMRVVTTRPMAFFPRRDKNEPNVLTGEPQEMPIGHQARVVKRGENCEEKYLVRDEDGMMAFLWRDYLEVSPDEPNPDDIVVAAHNSTVFVGRRGTEKDADWFADSITDRRKRYLCRRTKEPGNGGDVTAAPDFTPRKVLSADSALYVVGKYFPDLVGRRLFRRDCYWEYRLLGTITDGQQPRPTARPMEVLPEDQQTIKVGTILDCLWGYEQTNVDYYVVVKRKGPWVWLQEIGKSKVEETHWMQGTCEPDPENRIGDVFRRKVHVYHGKETGCSIKSYSWASPWDGTPNHWTAYH